MLGVRPEFLLVHTDMFYQSKPMAFYMLSIVFMLCGMAHAGTRYYDFVLEEKTFNKLCYDKSTLTVNGSFPGPELHVQKGDTVFVTVHNQGKYGVTIHWHGVRQPRNPWSDGPEYITQCPIAPGTSFTQEINFTDEIGTLWWHAHSDWSRATVHGAIIIHPADGTTYPFGKPDDEQTIVLASWYTADLMNPKAPGPQFMSFAINGEPGDFQMCSKETTYRMAVEYGKTYYLRVINAVVDSEIFFGIASHNLTVVGMDGAYVKPIIVDWVMITPGQTMDILVKANQAPSKYYMGINRFMDDPENHSWGTNAAAIFEYNGINVHTAPSTIPYPVLPGKADSDLVYDFVGKLRSLASPEYPIDVPKTITKRLTLNLSHDGNLEIATINNNIFTLPKIDILQAYYKNISGIYTSDFPTDIPQTAETTKSTRVMMVEYGDIVEIVFQSTRVNHPLHLHGYSFYLVGKGKGLFNSATDPQNYNLEDPPLVNTIGITRDGWAAIRFVADNPGVWFMHCHLEHHASWGMNAVLIVRDGSTEETSIRPPPAYLPPCSS